MSDGVEEERDGCYKGTDRVRDLLESCQCKQVVVEQGVFDV